MGRLAFRLSLKRISHAIRVAVLPESAANYIRAIRTIRG